MEQELYRSVVGAVTVVLHVAKRDLSRRVRLSVYQSINVPTLTYSHEFLVMTEIMRSQIIKLSARNELGSDIREELNVEPLGVRRFEHLVRMPPGCLPAGLYVHVHQRGDTRTDLGHAGDIISVGWPGNIL